MIKYTSTIDQVIKQLNEHKISVDEALSWMAYKGESIALTYLASGQQWSCMWLRDGNYVSGHHEAMREAVIETLKACISLLTVVKSWDGKDERSERSEGTEVKE